MRPLRLLRPCVPAVTERASDVLERIDAVVFKVKALAGALFVEFFNLLLLGLEGFIDIEGVLNALHASVSCSPISVMECATMV